MNSFSANEIKENSRFTKPIFLDENFLLLDAECPFKKETLLALLEWGFKKVLSDGKEIFTPTEEETKTENNYTEQISLSIQKKSLTEFEEVSFSDFETSDEKTPAQNENAKKNLSQKNSGLNSDSALQENLAKNFSEVSNEFISDSDSQKSPIKENAKNQNLNSNLSQKNSAQNKTQKNPSQAELEESVKKTYNEFFAYISNLYTFYATHKKLDPNKILEKSKELCIFIRENQKLVLKLTPESVAGGKNFLVSHSLRSTIYAVVIGFQIKLPMAKVIELCATCILHEIGQIRLPPQLYMSQKILSPLEKKQLATHTLLGYNILKENNFPLTMQLGVLEHHERENGEGYPRRLTSEKISLYAKIISVACSFEAITAPRDYKEERSTFEAMREMLQNDRKQYNETIIKALLFCVSIYPIGAYALLSDKRLAQVTDVNPNDPRSPIVQVIGAKNELGNPLTLQVDGTNVRIARILSKKNVLEMFKKNNQNSTPHNASPV